MNPETPIPDPSESPRPEHASQSEGEAQELQAQPVQAQPVQINPPTTATSGKRLVFREIRRQMSDADLASPGVQKLLLDELERAEDTCENLQGYVDRYHEADKRAAVLDEKLRTQNAVEIFFAVGLAMGGAIVGLAPFFWDEPGKGPIVLVVGAVLIVGSCVGRIVKK